MLPENRAPFHPGELLLEEFLEPMGITQTDFAGKLGVDIQRLNGIIKGRRAVSAETAWLLSKALGTSPEFWTNAQARWDLWKARKKLNQSGKLKEVQKVQKVIVKVGHG
jgi:addiction module HigA family antidote